MTLVKGIAFSLTIALSCATHEPAPEVISAQITVRVNLASGNTWNAAPEVKWFDGSSSFASRYVTDELRKDVSFEKGKGQSFKNQVIFRSGIGVVLRTSNCEIWPEVNAMCGVY